MLKVFFDTDNIGMITDMLDAEEHSHYPIQLFLSIDEPLKTRLRERKYARSALRSGRMYRTPFQAKTGRIYPPLLKRHPIFPVR